MTEQQSPWRFLTPLDGNDATDQDLISLTRQDELSIITNMVAASRVSILYAFSGNGKSSLINAGLIPFFTNEGYAVFTIRPRPPWSIENPSLAFKECVLRDINLPLFSENDLDLLREALKRLESTDDRQAKRIDYLYERFGSFAKDLSTSKSDINKFKTYLRNFTAEPLVKFISQISRALPPETRMIFVCDQFEELFVHYGNTPEMNNFVIQLGELWADSSIKSHILFSMREDWVGSMIEFRKSIPDIFSDYFKLNPITRNRASHVLKIPLEKFSGMQFEEEAVERILDDLVDAYSINQKKHFSEVKLTPSPKDDPFIELPALQVVANKLWQTKDKAEKPFSIEHYLSLRSLEKKNSVTDNLTPTQVVLDNYLAGYMNDLPGSDKLTQDQWRQLRTDCLYLLTDKTLHRCALSENLLLEEVNQIRLSGLDLPVVNKELLKEAIEPLVDVSLVRKETTKNNQPQYELAHDFAVRSAVNNWRKLEKRRTGKLAILNQEKKEKEEKYSRLEKNERRTLRFLQITPFVSIATMMITFLLYNMRIERSFDEMLIIISTFIIIIMFSLLFFSGLLNRHKLSVVLGGICGAAVVCATLGFFKNGPFYPENLHAYRVDPFFLISFPFVLFLLSFRSVIDISQRLADSAVIQKIYCTFWRELIDITLFSAIFTIILSIFSPRGIFTLHFLLALSFLCTPTWWLSKNGISLGSKWTRVILKNRDGKPISKLHALFRQLLFFLWILSFTETEILIFDKLFSYYYEPLFFILGPIITWIISSALIVKFNKSHRHIYDILSGTFPVLRTELEMNSELSDKEGTFQENKSKNMKSSPKGHQGSVFEAETGKLTSMEILMSIPVKLKMIPKDKIVLLTITGDKQVDKVKLNKDILKTLEEKKLNRLPVLDENCYPKYMINRSMLDKYLNKKITKDNYPADRIEDLTLKDLVDDDTELKEILETSFVTIKEDASLGDAKLEMEKVPNCQDIFVTKNGTKGEEVLGWITNLIITESAIV